MLILKGQKFELSANPSSAEPAELYLTSIARGVLSTAVLVALVSAGFGIVGMAHVKALEQRMQPVDTAKCTCDCFDGVMKGIYFRRTVDDPAVKEYKSIYVNHDWHSWLLVCWMTIYAGALAKLAGKLSHLFWPGRLRWSAVAMILPLVLLFQYNFTCMWHYLNDRFFSILFSVQLFFCATSFIYAVALYHLLDRQARLPDPLLLTALGVLFSHIFIALYEQGWDHLLKWNAHPSLVLRDGMFLFSDLALFLYLGRLVGRPTSPRLTVFGVTVLVCVVAFKISVWLAP